MMQCGADIRYQNDELLKEEITFAQLMDEWLEEKKEMVKESTYIQYYRLMNVHIKPELGAYMLSELSRQQLNDFLKEKYRSGRRDGKGGLSAKTVSDIRAVIIQNMEYAKSQNYPYTDVSHLFCPRQRQPDIEILSLEEQQKLEKILFENITPLKIGVLLALYGGLRIGEVCAIQWKDFSLNSGTIKISKTISRIQDINTDSVNQTKVIVEIPKTEKSNRIIPLPSFILKILKSYIRHDDCYIITGTVKYMEPRIFLNKYKKILEEAGLNSFTFHALRHTFATRCVENDFDPKSLSEILGHSDVSITLQRYVHPTLELKREQMEKLGRVSVNRVV